MTIKGEFLSICLNVLTAGEAPLIHEQVRGVGLGLGNKKTSTSKLVLLHLLFHTPLLGSAW